MSTPAKTRLASIDEAAEYLSVNPRTIRRRIAEGEIPAYRIAGTRTIRIRLEDLEASLRPIPSGAVSSRAVA